MIKTNKESNNNDFIRISGLCRSWCPVKVGWVAKKIRKNSDHGKKTKSFLIRTEVTGNWSKEGYLCPSSNKI